MITKIIQATWIAFFRIGPAEGTTVAAKVFTLAEMDAEQVSHLQAEVTLHPKMQDSNIAECSDVVVWEGMAEGLGTW